MVGNEINNTPRRRRSDVSGLTWNKMIIPAPFNLTEYLPQMLASWFRLKYPHVALGALASSAPVLYFDNITPQNGYFAKITEDFKETSVNCYEAIKQSWKETDDVALSNTCMPLSSSSELKNYLEFRYAHAAQYDDPLRQPVKRICDGIDSATKSGAHLLARIYAGIVASIGSNSCIDTNSRNPPSDTTSDAAYQLAYGWEWLTCSEIVFPIGRGINDTMFPANPFNFTERSAYCEREFGVPSRPHWVTTYYGGKNITLTLRRFGSNIIFSNGLRDPYSSGGFLEDISSTIVAVTTVKGSHCLDLRRARQTDPEWLTTQRKTEVDIITGWLNQYKADLAQNHQVCPNIIKFKTTLRN